MCLSGFIFKLSPGQVVRGHIHVTLASIAWMPVCSLLFYLCFYHLISLPLPSPLVLFFVSQGRVSTVIPFVVLLPGDSNQGEQCLFIGALPFGHKSTILQLWIQHEQAAESADKVKHGTRADANLPAVIGTGSQWAGLFWGKFLYNLIMNIRFNFSQITYTPMMNVVTFHKGSFC